MAKAVKFKNTCGQALYATTRKLTTEDLVEKTPEVFDTDFDGHAIMSLADVIGMIFPDGDVDKKPILYVRHTDMIKNEFRFGNLVELGDDYLSPQRFVYHEAHVAQAGVPITSYQKVEDKKDVFAFGSSSPKTEFQFSEAFFSRLKGNSGHMLFSNMNLCITMFLQSFKQPHILVSWMAKKSWVSVSMTDYSYQLKHVDLMV